MPVLRTEVRLSENLRGRWSVLKRKAGGSRPARGSLIEPLNGSAAEPRDDGRPLRPYHGPSTGVTTARPLLKESTSAWLRVPPDGMRGPAPDPRRRVQGGRNEQSEDPYHMRDR